MEATLEIFGGGDSFGNTARDQRGGMRGLAAVYGQSFLGQGPKFQRIEIVADGADVDLRVLHIPAFISRQEGRRGKDGSGIQLGFDPGFEPVQQRIGSRVF